MFRRLWAGDLLARLGYQVCEFGFPLMAVVVLHSSGFQAGLVTAAQFLPVVLVSLTAGVIADRADTRRLMLAASAVRGAALAVLGLVYATWGLSIWVLAAASLVVGAATVFYDVGFQSTIPRLLRPAELTRGNGLLQAGTSATQLAGPTLAGVLLQAAGLPLVVSVTTALFAGAVLAFWLLRTASLGTGDEPGRVRHSMLTGLRFTWGCRPIRDLCVQSGLFNLHEQAFITAFLLFGVRVAQLSAGEVGALLGVASIGALAGSVVSGRLAGWLHAGATVTAGLLTASASFLAGPLLMLALPAVPLAAALVFGAGFAVNGVAMGAYNVYVISLRQAIPPREFVGSATASYRMVCYGLNPVGALAGGTLADLMGPRDALLVVAASMTLVALTLLRSPVKRIRRVEEAHAAGTPS
ncbi:MAG TPA: MFS transporter [Streptosporangiaceae bacterium]